MAALTKAHKPSLLALPDPVGNRTVTNTTGRAVAEARHPWHSKRVRFATVPRCDVEPYQSVGSVCLSATVSLPPAMVAAGGIPRGDLPDDVGLGETGEHSGEQRACLGA